MKEREILEDLSAPLEKALNRLNETTMALGMKGIWIRKRPRQSRQTT